MSVLKLKPHRLEYCISSEASILDNGDAVEGNKEWKGPIACDAVPLSGKAAEVRFEDGTTKICSFVVYLDRDVRNFTLRDKVRIYLLDGSVKTGRVKGFVRYQMQCKLWV